MRTSRGRYSAAATLVLAVLLGLVTPAAATPNAGPGDAAPPEGQQIDGGMAVNRNREAVIAGYRSGYESLLGVPTGWTGSLDPCRAGTISDANAIATLDAVNYMRTLAGVRPVGLSAAMSKDAQAAALIMAANNFLSHFPPRSARCWSAAGYRGASHGNIYLGWRSDNEPGVDPLNMSTGPRSVAGYMSDEDEGNELVGHRRWLLYQALKRIGTGDTYTSNSIYVVSGERAAVKSARWVPWPAAGYFPLELEPKGRWSLTYPGADFRRAKISVRTIEGPAAVRRIPVKNGYGDNTISWQVALPEGHAAGDFRVDVTVSGIRVNGRSVTKRWSTTLVRASAAEPTPQPTDALEPIDDWNGVTEVQEWPAQDGADQ